MVVGIIRTIFKICKILFLVLFICNSGCSESVKTEKIKKTTIENALNEFIESMVEKKIGSNFIISPMFNDVLTDSLFNKLIDEKDSVLNQANIQYMISQYDTLKHEKIKKYLCNKYKSKVYYSKPNGKNIYVIVTPPLFTKNKNYFLIQMTTIFKTKDNHFTKDYLFYVFKKQNKNWNIYYLLKPDYDP